MRAAPTVVAFAVVGAVGGAVACGFVDRSLVSLVAVSTAVMCAILGAVVGRGDNAWLVTLALVPVAGAINGMIAISLAFLAQRSSGTDSLALLAIGALYGALFSTPFAIVLPPVAYVAMKRAARPKSLARRLELWHLGVATTIACLPFAWAALRLSTWTLRVIDDTLAPNPLVGILVLGISTSAVVALIGAFRCWLSAREAQRTVAYLLASEPARALGVERDPRYVDLGLGTTQHLHVEPMSTLRGTPVTRVVYEGDAPHVVRAAERALRWALVAVAGSLAIAWSYFSP